MRHVDSLRNQLYESSLATNKVAIPQHPRALQGVIGGAHNDPELIELLCRAFSFEFQTMILCEFEPTVLRLSSTKS